MGAPICSKCKKAGKADYRHYVCPEDPLTENSPPEIPKVSQADIEAPLDKAFSKGDTLDSLRARIAELEGADKDRRQKAAERQKRWRKK